MDDRQDNEEIGKLIRKRKEENEAFIRLLQAMKSQSPPELMPKTKRKQKPKPKP